MNSSQATPYYLTIIFIVNTLCCLAQNKFMTSDTFELKEVIITDSKTAQHVSKYSFQNLENYSGRKLPDLLNEISGIYLKNYGNGQLTSIAVRGTATTQTEVLWNGIKINSIMLGQSDFSLLNVGFHNNINIQFNQLNSAIGSNISLNNALPQNATHFEGIIRAGSFGLLESNMNLSYGNSKLRGATKFALLKSKNNFSITKGGVRQKQNNAEVLQYAAFQQLNYLLNAKNEIAFYAWFNHADREIPPTLLQEASKTFQSDQSFRSMLQWKFHHQQLRMNFSTAYLYETLLYNNSLIQEESKSSTHTWRNNFQFNYRIKNFLIDANAFIDYERALSENYEDKEQRIVSGLSVKTDYYLPVGFKFSAGLRQELMNKQLSPFMPYASINFSKNIKQHFIGIEFTGKRSFRFPTFNDLFWINSGNQHLETEKSWNIEASANYKLEDIFTFSFSNYYTWINNQIQWTPDVSGNWRPQNLKAVFARGVETSTIFNLPATKIKHFSASVNISYAYTLSTQSKSTLANDGALGKQLIYVPRHRLSSSASITYFGFTAALFYRYTGLRYISTDNSDALAPYSIFDIEFSKLLHFTKSSIKLAFRVNNLSNVIYQDVAQLPMPTRNFKGTLSIKL